MVEERLRFVVLASRPESNMAKLCQEFGVSRQTGYNWLRRYQAGGAKQVVERSRRPRHSPLRIREEIENKIVQLRQERPDGGAPKLKVLLERQPPGWVISERTVHRVLNRRGLILDEDRPVRATKRFERGTPNELWQMDFKGPQGFNRPGASVGPLVILDDHRRMMLALQHLGSTKAQGVRNTWEAVFRECGLPEAMLFDHGTPWWNNQSPWGLSELSVWILRHGVRIDYCGVRHPPTQGKTERANGCLQRAVRKRQGDPTAPPWLDSYRHEHNHIRPSEALDMQTPATRWKPSARKYQEQPPEWVYPSSMTVLPVQEQGYVRWQGRRWEISKALRHERIGIELLGDRALVYFCNNPMRELDLSNGQTYAIPTPIRIPNGDVQPPE